MIEITQLRKIRKNLNLTQYQMAQKIGISQSMVAKIESGKLDPTYSYVKKIESSLVSLTKEGEKQAKDIMTVRVLKAKSTDSAEKMVKIMNKHSISQIPVLQGKNVIGLITESSILNKGIENLSHLKAHDIMEEIPPILSQNTSISIIKQILMQYSCILIKDSVSLEGIITKADLLKNLP